MEAMSGCGHPCSSVVNTLWVFVGLLLVMFGVAWLAAGRLSRGLRPALRAMAGFNLFNGAGLMLFAQAGVLSGFVTGPLVNLLQFCGYVLLWRAGAGLTGAPDAWREQRLLLLLACPLSLLLGMLPGLEQLRHAFALATHGWVLVRGCSDCSRQLRLSGAVGLALALRLTCAVATLALATRAVGGIWLGADVDVRFDGMTRLGWMLLAPIFIVNVLAAYQAFGRTVEDADRLARQDRLTGLADAATLDGVLAQEWRRLRQWGSPVVLMELVVDQLDLVRRLFGAQTADAVLAELAWKLKLGLRAGDVLAHCGDGVFRVLLLGTRGAPAMALAQDLLAKVGSDDGLHPESGQRLTLSIGLAEADADDAGPQAVLRRAQAQVQVARLAGGDRVVAEAVLPQPQAMHGRRATVG
jgi:diguanylate cyclase (GGDEF)-like protein